MLSLINKLVFLNSKSLLILICFVFSIVACQNFKISKMSDHLKITETPYGILPSGKKVSNFELVNKQGTTVSIINYGGIITSLKVKDKSGNLDNVVLGYNSLEEYLINGPYLGCIIGRFGNRIANGKFTLNDTIYNLKVNNGPNHLHGGEKGFDKVLWDAEIEHGAEVVSLYLSYTSPHMEEGYPGNLSTRVTYSLNNANEFVVSYHAQTDATTIVNLTQHSYFNLSGDFNNNILDHQLQLKANKITALNNDMIPTGAYLSVKDTPLDFTKSKLIGKDIASDFEQIKIANGYDHNFVIDSPDINNAFAKVNHTASGRVMEVFTDQPGVQLYTGNFLEATSGTYMDKRSGFCLETQHFPDAPNQPNFPSVILEPGAVYKTTTKFKFSIQK